jgi:tetratricopeptide (TPR) repeat protein
MSSTPGPPSPALAAALERLRLGDLAGARSLVEGQLAEAPDGPEAPTQVALAGLIAARMGDPAGAIPWFRRALAASPDDPMARGNLATALISVGELDQAGEVVGSSADPGLQRLSAYVEQQRGRLDQAASSYRAVVAAFPDDFESWNNLGNVLAAAGDKDGAIEAFQQAISLRPDIIAIYLNLSEVLASAERPELRQAVMREAARRASGDPRVLTELGLAEAGAQQFDAAERAYRAALRLNARYTSAYVELGMLLETHNRIDDLSALVEEAEAMGMADAEIGFLKAWLLRRQGRFEEALPLAQAVPESISPLRSAQLLAEIYDRLGDPPRAFAAFEAMNRASAAAAPPRPGGSYRDQVTSNTALLTQEWVDAWTKVDLDRSPASPIFIVGFPRSGTTLLDTLLMNLPDLHVLEEMPVINAVEEAIGDQARLATLGPEEAAQLRARYFDALESIAPAKPGQTIVDKYPLSMARMPLIHRLFPDAKIVFVERHPCDAVLSAFMSNFQLNQAMRSFVSLEEAARTYAAVFESWTRAEALLPLDVHRIRYERMVEDLEGEMRPLLSFLGLGWDSKVLDNRAGAAGRTYVRTASYAQISEPIYRRSAGRWARYREQMADVLPILAPWVERLDYTL